MPEEERPTRVVTNNPRIPENNKKVESVQTLHRKLTVIDITEDMKRDLERRGAIFGVRPLVFAPH